MSICVYIFVNFTRRLIKPFENVCFLLRRVSCIESFNNFFSSITWSSLKSPGLPRTSLLSSNYSSPNPILLDFVKSYRIMIWLNMLWVQLVGLREIIEPRKVNEFLGFFFFQVVLERGQKCLISRSWILGCKAQCSHLLICRESSDEKWVIPILINAYIYISIYVYIHLYLFQINTYMKHKSMFISMAVVFN